MKGYSREGKHGKVLEKKDGRKYIAHEKENRVSCWRQKEIDMGRPVQSSKGQTKPQDLTTTMTESTPQNPPLVLYDYWTVLLQALSTANLLSPFSSEDVARPAPGPRQEHWALRPHASHSLSWEPAASVFMEKALSGQWHTLPNTTSSLLPFVRRCGSVFILTINTGSSLQKLPEASLMCPDRGESPAPATHILQLPPAGSGCWFALR